MAERGYQTIAELLRAGLRREVTPVFYFDTNVILDIIDRRQQSSFDLFDFLIKRKWELVTSIFAKVEIYETKQKDEFRRQKEKEGWSDEKIGRNINRRDLPAEVLSFLSQQVNANLSGMIEHFNPFTYLIEEGWAMAEDIKQSTNLTDKDSIHLAEARAVACDIFLTRHELLIDIAKEYIWAAKPDEIVDILGIE